MSPELLINSLGVFIGAFAGAAAAYAAIKSDITETRTIAIAAKETSDKAHVRIDQLYLKDK